MVNKEIKSDWEIFSDWYLRLARIVIVLGMLLGGIYILITGDEDPMIPAIVMCPNNNKAIAVAYKRSIEDLKKFHSQKESIGISQIFMSDTSWIRNGEKVMIRKTSDDTLIYCVYTYDKVLKKIPMKNMVYLIASC